MIQQRLAVWSLVPLPFLKPAWTSGSSQFTYCWSLPWRILSITCQHVKWVWLSSSLNILWHCPPLGKLAFSSFHSEKCDHCWVFQICWHTECTTLTASSFRIWNSSTGIQSPPLALIIVMLPKAHLTSHSRMSISRWVITPLWLSWSWRSFLYSSSVYPCHLFLISSASVRSIPFLSFTVLIFAWNVPLVSLIFLKRSLVFDKLESSLPGEISIISDRQMTQPLWQKVKRS